MDNIVLVKVVMLEESLLQGIEREVINVYTVKSIFDESGTKLRQNLNTVYDLKITGSKVSQ